MNRIFCSPAVSTLGEAGTFTARLAREYTGQQEIPHP